MSDEDMEKEKAREKKRDEKVRKKEASRPRQASSSDDEQDANDGVGKRGGRNRRNVKGSGERVHSGGRKGYWMTERYGPQKMQYKRVYVNGSGLKFSGKAAFAVSFFVGGREIVF